MGIFCMILGVIVFLGMTGGGYLVADKIAMALAHFPEAEMALGQTWGEFLSISSGDMQFGPSFYAIVCGFFGVIGLLIGLSLFMQGLTYQKLCAVARRRRRRFDD